jgi:integrase/recombinase XerC
MGRPSQPPLSESALQALTAYEQHLREERDVSPATLRNYLSDLRQFLAWFESTGQPTGDFAAAQLTTPTITRYRAYLQGVVQLRAASVNRALVSIKSYCAWATDHELLTRDPARPVKMVAEEPRPPRHLTDQQEAALLAAVTAGGNLRDRTLLVVMLHTGLRAQEACDLQRKDLRLAARSGTLEIWGKRNKYREVPLNATARAALSEWLEELPEDQSYLFPSGRTGRGITPRALGQLVKKYARQAGVPDLHPHDLRHRFGYRMAESVPLHRLAQIMGHDSLDTTRVYTQGTASDLQQEVEKIAWE